MMNYDECTYAARLNGLHIWRGNINYSTAEITVYYYDGESYQH